MRAVIVTCACSLLTIQPMAWAKTGLTSIDDILGKVQTPVDEISGYESIRKIKVIEKDPDSMEAIQEKLIERKVQDFHSKDRVSEVLKCSIDNKPSDLSDCEDGGDKAPIWPIFAKDQSQYSYKLIGESKGLWQVEVLPKEETKRHFKGVAYINQKFELDKMVGTLADLPFGLHKFSLDINFKTVKGYPVATDGNYTVEVKVPLVVHKIFESKFIASGERLILQNSPHGKSH